LVRREVTSRVGPDVLLEAADGCAGQWPEDAVCRPFVAGGAIRPTICSPIRCAGSQPRAGGDHRPGVALLSNFGPAVL